MNDKFLTKRSLIIFIVFIVLLIVLVFSITYAFFAARINNEEAVNVTAKTGSGSYAFTVYQDGSIDYEITGDLMSNAGISNEPVGTDNANLLVNLSSPDEDTTVICTYDILWEWLSTDQYTEPSTTLDDSVYPYEFSVAVTKSEPIGDTSGYQYTDSSLIETDLSKFIWTKENGEESNMTTLVSSAQIASRSVTPTQISWNVESNLYNIPTNQNILMGKKYHSKIYIDNISCNLYDTTPKND